MAQGQRLTCGWHPTPELNNYDLQNLNGVARTTLLKANKVFSVHIYICRDVEENPVTNNGAVQNMINSLNGEFAPIGFSFKVCATTDVPDYRYRHIDEQNRFQEILNLHYQPEVINIYITDTVNGGQAAGFASAPGGPDAIVLDNSSLDAVTHEMGHFFGLRHTFETSTGVELADGSNCLVAGDFVCDTPADPDGQYDSQTCQHQGPVFDPAGNRYAPPYDNHMSYYPCACRFSQEQFLRMYDIYINLRNYLK